jgi:hypothetical protein
MSLNFTISIWLAFVLFAYVAAQNACSDMDSQACAYYVKNYPSYCTSSIAHLKKVRFNIYCMLSCNNCNAATITPPPVTYTSSSSASSNLPVTTPSTSSLSTSSGSNCKNIQDFPCHYFLQIYTDFCQSPTIFLGGQPFNVFCAKSCKYMC